LGFVMKQSYDEVFGNARGGGPTGLLFSWGVQRQRNAVPEACTYNTSAHG